MQSRLLQTSRAAGATCESPVHTLTALTAVGAFARLLREFLTKKKKVVEIIFINFQRHPLSDPWQSAPSLSDSRRMSCQSPNPLHPPPSPGCSSGAGKQLRKKKGGRAFGFPGRRLLQGAILRRPARPLAANVLAADGGEASKFTLTAERNRAEHLLMNERAAH